MLEIDGIEVRYGRTPAVHEATLRVDPGEIVCVVGPNGAGKSTTLLTIAGALRPAKGDIRLRGQSIAGLSPEHIARGGVSLVPEGRHVFGALTIEENLRLGTYMRSDRAAIRQDFEAVLAKFPFLAERLGSPAGKLSGGEQQQLVIARALMTRPSLLLIDEPALGLAPLIIAQVYRTLKELKGEGIALLVVEQSTERALALADRIYVMRSGKIALSGRAADLVNDSRMMFAYFGFEAE